MINRGTVIHGPDSTQVWRNLRGSNQRTWATCPPVADRCLEGTDRAANAPIRRTAAIPRGSPTRRTCPARGATVPGGVGEPPRISGSCTAAEGPLPPRKGARRKEAATQSGRPLPVVGGAPSSGGIRESELRLDAEADPAWLLEEAVRAERARPNRLIDGLVRQVGCPDAELPTVGGRPRYRSID